MTTSSQPDVGDSPTPLLPPSSPPAAAPSERELDRSLVRGVAWTGSVKWLTQLISWPITIVTARLLSPDDYGYLALVTVFTRFVQLLAEGGVGTAIVVGPALSTRQMRQLTALGWAAGATGALTTIALAHPIAAYYRSPPIVWVVIAISGTLFLDGVALVPASRMRREFRFKELAIIEMARNLIDQLLTLTLAVLGARYWSLVGGYAAGVASFAALVYWRSPIALAWPRWKEVGSSVRFSAQIVLRSAADFLSSSSDRVVIGRVGTSGDAGAYTMATTIAVAPIEKLSAMVTRVAPSLFGTLREDLPTLRRYVLRIAEVVAMVTLPLLAGLAAVADDVVAVLFGPRWAGVVGPLRWFCVAGIVGEMLVIIPHVLRTLGAAHVLARNGIVTLFVIPPAFAVAGWQFGISGVAAVYALVGPLLYVPLVLEFRARSGLGLREFLGNLVPTLTCVALMLAAVLGLRQVGAVGAMAPTPRLLLLVAVGGLVYFASLITLFRARVRALLAFVQRIR